MPAYAFQPRTDQQTGLLTELLRRIRPSEPTVADIGGLFGPLSVAGAAGPPTTRSVIELLRRMNIPSAGKAAEFLGRSTPTINPGRVSPIRPALDEVARPFKDHAYRRYINKFFGE